MLKVVVTIGKCKLGVFLGFLGSMKSGLWNRMTEYNQVKNRFSGKGYGAFLSAVKGASLWLNSVFSGWVQLFLDFIQESDALKLIEKIIGSWKFRWSDEFFTITWNFPCFAKREPKRASGLGESSWEGSASHHWNTTQLFSCYKNFTSP